MKSNTVQCGEYPVRILFGDDKALAWINLQDLCKVLGRDETRDIKEAIRVCPSCIQIPFRQKGREMWAVSPYDVYKLMRPMRKENALIARNCDKVEAWLNELLEKSAIQSVRLPQQQEDMVFSYQDHPISFRAANGRVMINATQMAKSFGVLPAEILRKAEFIRYRQHLVDKGVSENLDSQVYTTRGRNNGATWIEEALATEFARQLSPEFSEWCNTKINELVTKGYATLGNQQMPEDKDDGQIVHRELPVPQNLDEAREIIAAQHRELQQQQHRIIENQPKVEFYDNLIEGRDFYSTTWLAQELGITPHMVHQFLAEKGICKFEKNQWITFTPFRAWQIEVPYYLNNFRIGKQRAAGTRMRWSKAGREQIIDLWNREGEQLPKSLPRRKYGDFPDDLEEGTDYFTSTQLAQRLNTSSPVLHRFLAENNICRFEKKQWVVHKPYAEWQMDVPYRWTNPKTGKRWVFGTRKRWTPIGLEQITALWNKRPQTPPNPSGQAEAKPPRKPRERKERPYDNLTEGIDYFSPTQLARELGISAILMNKFLEENNICKLVKKEWAVLELYAGWQMDIPYYWTNPKTGKRWAFGTRKRWTKLGREKIIEMWYKKISGKEAQNAEE